MGVLQPAAGKATPSNQGRYRRVPQRCQRPLGTGMSPSRISDFFIMVCTELYDSEALISYFKVPSVQHRYSYQAVQYVQTLTSNRPINIRRTAAIAAFGFLWSGPTAHYWQAWLQKRFPKKTDVSLAQKVAFWSISIHNVVPTVRVKT